MFSARRAGLAVRTDSNANLWLESSACALARDLTPPGSNGTGLLDNTPNEPFRPEPGHDRT